MNKYAREYVNAFQNRWENIRPLLFGKKSIFGPVKDYFWRVEFQMRGTGHIHLLIFLDKEKFTPQN